MKKIERLMSVDQASNLYAFRCWARAVIARQSTRYPYEKNTPNRDKALIAMAVHMSSYPSAANKERLRKLILCGASPDALEWLPFRMAACVGDSELMAWLVSLSMPSPHAIEDAMDWAIRSNHPQAAAWISRWRQSLKETLIRESQRIHNLC